MDTNTGQCSIRIILVAQIDTGNNFVRSARQGGNADSERGKWRRGRRQLLADLVGPNGEIIGTDTALTGIEAAEKRVNASSLANLTFRHGDPTAMVFDRPFGRHVLQFMPKPSAAIARLSSHLQHGGIMFFHELDWEGARSSPPVPTYERVCGWIARTIEGGGAQTRLGAHLASAFERAGHSTPTLRLESVIASGSAAIDVIHLVTDLVATQLPNMERMGITNASEVESPTLAQRTLAEAGPTPR